MKEKFGELRVYYRPTSQLADQMIDRCAKLCATKCMVCGSPAVLSHNGLWAQVTCDEHKMEDQ